MATVIYSAITGLPVDNKLAMTGEVSIRGQVKPIGGVVAKVEAARQAGATRVIIPEDNWQASFEHLEGLTVIPVTELSEVIDLALGRKVSLSKEEDQVIAAAAPVENVPAAL